MERRAINHHHVQQSGTTQANASSGTGSGATQRSGASVSIIRGSGGPNGRPGGINIIRSSGRTKGDRCSCPGSKARQQQRQEVGRPKEKAAERRITLWDSDVEEEEEEEGEEERERKEYERFVANVVDRRPPAKGESKKNFKIPRKLSAKEKKSAPTKIEKVAQLIQNKSQCPEPVACRLFWKWWQGKQLPSLVPLASTSSRKTKTCADAAFAHLETTKKKRAKRSAAGKEDADVASIATTTTTATAHALMTQSSTRRRMESKESIKMLLRQRDYVCYSMYYGGRIRALLAYSA